MHERREPRKDPRRILENARSPYRFYCEGFGNNDSKGCYVTTPIIAAGRTKHAGSQDRSLVLEQIQAFDTAEAEGAYIGQINLFQVSSFCGLNGLIWGHDVVKCGRQVMCDLVLPRSSGSAPIYQIDPLLAAGKRLLGTARKRRFPIIPGSMVPAAYKSLSGIGPATLYGGLAIGIPADDRASAALFMEYVGSTAGASSHDVVENEKRRILIELFESVLEVGANHDMEFEMVYLGTRALAVGEQRLGCILVAVPYLTLADSALSSEVLDNIEGMTLDEWEARVSERFYCRVMPST